jgi:hypothetical protein
MWGTPIRFQQTYEKPLHTLFANAEAKLVRCAEADDLISHPVECVEGDAG